MHSRRGANPQSPTINPDGDISPCRLVFIVSSVIYSFYRDPSLTLRMTVEGGLPIPHSRLFIENDNMR